MAKSEVEELTYRTIERGGILAKLYFDMQSQSPDDLQPLMADLINNRLLKEKGVVYCFGAIEEPIKLDNVYSTSSIVTALFSDVGALMSVMFSYMPVGLEILKPENEFRIKTNQLNSVLLSLSDIALNYSQYIMGKVMSKEDRERMEKDLKNRELVGRRLMEKKDKNE